MNRIIFNIAAKTDRAGRPSTPNQDNIWVCPDLTKFGTPTDKILGTDEDVISKDLESEVEKKLLGNAIAHLSERERQIVELRFGLHTPDGKELTQKEVADILGISQSYISRLEKKIMKRLKKEIVRFE